MIAINNGSAGGATFACERFWRIVDRALQSYKDTVKANPGYFTTIRAKFDLPSGVSAPQAYVHHCHIVEHEDNDMMRPFVVRP